MTARPRPGHCLHAHAVCILTLSLVGAGFELHPPFSWFGILGFELVMLAGAVLFALIVANMTSAILSAEVISHRFDEEMKTIRDFMDQNGLEPGLRDRIENFFAYLFIKQKGMLEERLLAEMPPKLRSEVTAVAVGMVCTVPFFDTRFRQRDFPALATQYFFSRVYTPNSTLVYAHESQRELFLVREGCACVVHIESLAQLQTLHVGDQYGCFQLLCGGPHPVSVQTTARFVETLVLTFEALRRLLKHAESETQKEKSTTTSAASQPAHLERSTTVSAQSGSSGKLGGSCASLDERDPGVDAVIAAYKSTLLRWSKRHAELTNPGEVGGRRAHKISEEGRDSEHEGDTARLARTAQNSMRVSGDAGSSSFKLFGPASSSRRNGEQSRFIIFPFSVFHIVWGPMRVLATAYIAIAAPVRVVEQMAAAVGEHQSTRVTFGFDPTLIVDYACELLFLVDMWLHARVFAFNSVSVDGHDILVVDPVAIRKHYLGSTRFAVDLFASLPCVLSAVLALIAPSLGHGGVLLPLSLLRLPSLIRMCNFAKYIADVASALTESAHSDVSKALVTCVRMLLVSVIVVTWCACIWAGYHIRCQHDDNVTRDACTLDDAVFSTFMTLHLFTQTDYAEIVEWTTGEQYIWVLIGAFGMLYNATVISNISQLLHSVDISGENVHHRRGVLRKFMSENSISSELQRRVLAYLHFIEEEKLGVDEMTVLHKYLPDHLRSDVMLFLSHRAVLGCKVFDNLESGFVLNVMLRLDRHFHMKDEIVVRQGEAVSGMYFVGRGAVQLLVYDPSVSTAANRLRRVRVGVNQSFCEDAMLDIIDQCPLSAIVEKYSELWYLSRNVLCSLLLEFPSVFERLPDMRARARSIARSRFSDTATEYLLQNAALSQTRPSVVQEETRKALEASRKASAALTLRERCAIAPESSFAFFWHSLMLGVVFFTVMAITFAVSFLEAVPITPVSIAVAAACDALLALDVLLRARFFAHWEGDVLRRSPRDISRHYLRTNYVTCQLIALLPLEACYPLARGRLKRYVGPLQLLTLFRCNKLLRIVDLPSLADKFQYGVQQRGLRMLASKNAVGIIKLVGALFMCAHFFGCGIFVIGNARHLDGRTDNWLDAGVCMNEAVCVTEDARRIASNETLDGLHRAPVGYQATQKEIIRWYSYSVYWAMALLTNGSTNVGVVSKEEVAFGCGVLVVGALLYTVLITKLQDILAQIDVTKSLYRAKISKAQQYCARQHLPEGVCTAIFSYYEKLWAHQRGVSGSDVMLMLPRNLRTAMVKELAGPLIEKCFFVKEQRACFMEELMHVLRLEMYMPHDFLFHAGECAMYLFFIFQGEATLLNAETSESFASLEDTTIGEFEFFTRTLYPTSAQIGGSTHAQVCLLTFDAFWRVVEHTMTTEDFYEHVNQSEALRKLEQDSAEALVARVKQERRADTAAKKTKTRSLYARASEDRDGVDSTVDSASSTCMTTIAPNSRARRLWDALMCVGLAYFIFSVPYELACAFDAAINEATIVIDALLIVLFAADVALHLTLFQVNHQGVVFTEVGEFRAVYMRGSFRNDAISLAPLGHLCWILGESPWLFALVRVTQLARIMALPKLFHAVMEVLQEDVLGWRITTVGVVRLVEMLLLLTIVVHIVACLFYSIGRFEQSRDMPNWIDAAQEDVWGTEQDRLPSAFKYRQAMYWAFCTCSSIGFGGVDLISDTERFFAMLAMVIGVLLTDAGLLASVMSIVEHIYFQSNSNKRRTACTEQFMAGLTNERIRDDVLGYFRYIDSEQKNLSETSILDDLNISLRNGILHLFAHHTLCDSLTYGGHEPGIVATIVYMMTPYIAVPGELVLERGASDPSLFIFIAGKAHTIDSCGDHEVVSTGTILSNVEFAQAAKRVGMPTRKLSIGISRVEGIPRRCHPYVEALVTSNTVFGASRKTFTTTVRKFCRAANFDEKFTLKVYAKTSAVVLTVKNYRRGIAGKDIGSCVIALDAYEGPQVSSQAGGEQKQKTAAEDDGEEGSNESRKPSAVRDLTHWKWHTIHADVNGVNTASAAQGGGKTVGRVLVATKLEALTKEHIARKPELTVVADTFCHFYLLDYENQEAIKAYMKRMRLPVMQRLPGYKKGGAPSALKKLVSRVVKNHRTTKSSSFVDVALAASHEATGKNLKESFHAKSAHTKSLREVQTLVEHAFDNSGPGSIRLTRQSTTKNAIRQSMGAIRQSIRTVGTASGAARAPRVGPGPLAPRPPKGAG